MIKRFFFMVLVATLAAGESAGADQRSLPRLERRGHATQLIVDDRPYLVLGGELNNTAASDREYLKTVWPRLVELNVNTALVAVGWDWIEPEEGKFDFSVVDDVLQGARDHNLRVIFIWFGSWKNGMSSFAPDWVKIDQRRFPRVRVRDGKAVEILSPFGPQTLAADTAAYSKFIEHLGKVDKQRTVVMVQLQNEVGIFGDSRDRSEVAEAAFRGPVPKQLISHLQLHRQQLHPDLAALWENAGGKTEGTWAQFFGTSNAANEVFMAWSYAQFMGHMAEAGKRVYALPVFTNSWLVQPTDKGPGDYPSGGPQPHILDIWKAGSPAIDFSAPDIYLPDFERHATAFHRSDNPLFVPEALGDANAVGNAIYAIGTHNALGFSPFGIEDGSRLGGNGWKEGVDERRKLLLAKGYAELSRLAPMILDHQAAGTIGAVRLTKEKPRQEVPMGDYTVTFQLTTGRDTGYGLVLALGTDEFLVLGANIQVTFPPRTPGDPISGLLRVDQGYFENGHWVTKRRLNGDDVVLINDLKKAGDVYQSSGGLLFYSEDPSLQKVSLYRFR
jgi:beta-galactosidase GanA